MGEKVATIQEVDNGFVVHLQGKGDGVAKVKGQMLVFAKLEEAIAKVKAFLEEK